MNSKIKNELSGKSDNEIQKYIAELDSQIISLYEKGQYDEAIEHANLYVDAIRQLVGEQHPEFAESLNNLAFLYHSTGRYDIAEPLYKQSIEITQMALDKYGMNLVQSVSNLAQLYTSTNNVAAAEPLLKQAVEINRAVLGEQHPGFAQSLNNLAMLYQSTGQYAIAEPLLKQALEIYRLALGNQHPDFALSLNNLAFLYHSMCQYAVAEPLYKQAIEVYRAASGEQHPNLVVSLNNLAFLYNSTGQYAAAQPLFKQVLEINRAFLGEQHPEFAQSLNNLALVHRSMGQYLAAEPLIKQALEINRLALGEQHPNVALGLNNLATVYQSKGQYLAAEPLLHQALEIYRLTLGEQHPDFAQTLNNLAMQYELTGQYTAAEPLLKQTIEINRSLFGEQHQNFAMSLNNLALLYSSMGQYAAAEPLFKQAIETASAALGEQHPDLAASLNNLGLLYHSTGNFVAAEPLFERAAEISLSALGEKHSNLALSINNLAMLHQSSRRYESAQFLFKKAMEIYRDALGEQHPDFAQSANNLAMAYQSTGQYAEAEPLLHQAMEIQRVTLGERHTNFALSLNNLAFLYHSMGDYAAAEPFYKRAIEVNRGALGEYHPSFALSLNNLARLFAATGREVDAIEIMQQTLAIEDRIVGQIFSIGSERQRTAYLQTVRHGFDIFFSLINQHLNPSLDVVRSALTLVLRRKAIEAEALAVQRDALLGGKYPEAASRLRELTTLRAQIAQKTLSGAGNEGLQAHQQLLAEWNVQKELIEAKVARQVPEMNIEQKLRSIDHKVVAMKMPAGTTLVEFVLFYVFDFKAVPAREEPAWRSVRYLAFVMHAGEPDNISMIDLGEAEHIDQLIALFRSTITGEEEFSEDRDMKYTYSSVSGSTSEDVGVQLRDTIFTPLLKALGNRKRLMISPDGNLTRLPFEVLPTDDGRRLIDDYRISYLGAGRDVVRFDLKSNRTPARSLVAADPDFDLGAEVVHTEPLAIEGRQSKDLDRDSIRFNRLQGTRIEGEQIAAKLDAELWTEGAALDARLKQCQSPRILHLATHGFFLEDQERRLNEDLSGTAVMSFSDRSLERLLDMRFENPLLRSGIALAGVNTWLKGGELMKEAEDGLLTAEDVSGLDLLDTELVVLSACETGLGEVRVGEGVFGLRRAFVLAGAKTLVMSLWKVPDRQTQELMENFYSRILAGEPRAYALQQAQLAIKARYPDPFYWGAFICQGYDGPLSN